MTDWLVSESALFGVAAPNWMLLIGGIFLVYGIGHALLHTRRRPG